MHQTEAISNPTIRVAHLVRIEAIIEAPALDALRAELSQWAVALTWTTVEWSGARTRREIYRGCEYQVDSARMVRLEALAPPSVAERVTDALERAIARSALGGYVCDERWGGDLVHASVPRLDRAAPSREPRRR